MLSGSSIRFPRFRVFGGLDMKKLKKEIKIPYNVGKKKLKIFQIHLILQVHCAIVGGLRGKDVAYREFPPSGAFAR